MINCNFCTY